MNKEYTDKDMAGEFAYVLTEKYYEDNWRPSPGEWLTEEGKCLDLFEDSEDWDDRSQYEGWTYTYDYSSAWDCGRDNCREIACGLRHIAQITIDIGGGIKYEYTLDRHGDLEES